MLQIFLIKPECVGAAGQFIVKIGAGPIDHRHKVVADGLYATVRQVLHRCRSSYPRRFGDRDVPA